MKDPLSALAVVARARAWGAPWTELNVYAWNGEARRVYEALGYLPLSTKLGKQAPSGRP